MAPKRKAAAAATSAITATSGPAKKKVRIGDESIISNDNTRESTPASTASGRARRSTAAENPVYNHTKPRSNAKVLPPKANKTAVNGSTTRGGGVRGRGGRGRGRGGRGSASTVQGRSKGNTGTGVTTEVTEEVEVEENEEDEGDINGTDEEETLVKSPAAKSTLKGILKNKDAVTNGEPFSGESNGDPVAEIGGKRGRGRPRGSGKGQAEEVKPAVEVVVKKGGRGRGRGRPKGGASATQTSNSSHRLKVEEIDGLTDEEALTKSATLAGLENVDPDVQYWLMKAEPESRIEKGVDVKFSIDDLASKTEPEGWDGVRNFIARNNMRAMRRGDLAFFYHSNCKVPGIVGVMRIVEEHSTDESAFDPGHPYYDPKSTDRSNPKWELVKVEFVKKFENMMTLKELRSYAGKDGALENMQMLKQSRLSVSSVSVKEWKFIFECLGEDIALGQPDKNGGYEGDTDGESEEPVVDDAGAGINSSFADATGVTDGLDNHDGLMDGTENREDGFSIQEQDMENPFNTPASLHSTGITSVRGSTVVNLSEVVRESGGTYIPINGLDGDDSHGDEQDGASE